MINISPDDIMLQKWKHIKCSYRYTELNEIANYTKYKASFRYSNKTGQIIDINENNRTRARV